MSPLKQWQSGIVLTLVLGISTATVAPLFYPVAVVAAPERYLPEGTIVRVSYEKNKRIVVASDETVPLTLTVSEDVRSPNGRIAIPYGSTIKGRLEPFRRGSRFVAERLILPNDRSVSIDAVSEAVTRTEEIRKGTNVTPILAGAAVGAGAAALISGITGDRHISILEVLGGAGVGALGGAVFGPKNSNRGEVIVIRPDEDLNLKLRSDLEIPRYGAERDRRRY